MKAGPFNSRLLKLTEGRYRSRVDCSSRLKYIVSTKPLGPFSDSLLGMYLPCSYSMYLLGGCTDKEPI